MADAHGRAGAPPRAGGDRPRDAAAAKLLHELPLADLDTLATGAEVAWFREAMASPARDGAYWERATTPRTSRRSRRPCSSSAAGTTSSCPGCSRTSPRCGRRAPRPSSSSGPGRTRRPGSSAAGVREALGWLRAHLLGDDRLVRPDAVRIRVTGERVGDGWRALERLAAARHGRAARCGSPAAGRLQRRRARRRAGADGYRYDPADPTPSLGGPLLLARHPVVDNAPLEARADVLTYTTAPLPHAGRGDRRRPRRAARPRERAALRPLRARLRRRPRAACRATSATRSSGSRPSASSTAPTGPGASPSTCGRWATASPPATASACRSPPARTRATRATPAPARTR